MGIVRTVLERLLLTEVMSVLIAMICMHDVTEARRSCGVDARVHPDGICGESLIRARNMLCFLLYEAYPDRFPNHKRSTADIFSYPVQAFAKMSLSGHEEDLQKTTGSVAVPPTESSQQYLPLLPKYRSTLLPRPLPSAAPTRGGLAGALATKRAVEEALPRVQKRGLVCDCCYNKCLPSILARYC